MRHTLVATVLLAASPLTPGLEARPVPLDQASAALLPAVAKGDAAIDAFRTRLLSRLNELIVQGGPAHAIQVCRTEAPVIAAEVGGQHHVQLGRTSHRLRNAANAPRPWARSWVEGAGDRKAADVKAAVVDLGDRIGLLRPIAVMPACTRCHGAADGIDPEVRAELARAYPADRATGFAPGDLRGFIWVEVPKR